MGCQRVMPAISLQPAASSCLSTKHMCPDKALPPAAAASALPPASPPAAAAMAASVALSTWTAPSPTTKSSLSSTASLPLRHQLARSMWLLHQTAQQAQSCVFPALLSRVIQAASTQHASGRRSTWRGCWGRTGRPKYDMS